MTLCNTRLTIVIPIQQLAPIIIGFPPVLISLMISVFNPIAAIAITIKNLLSSLNGVKKLVDTPQPTAIVVITDAPIKYKIKNIYLEGAKSNVSDYYKRASFICLTSFYEGWGMSLTEGMAYGCIPFTFNNYGAASDIIDDEINGCLIPAYKLGVYANRLSELMNNEDKRIKMSKAAVEKVKKFSVENVTDKWDELFKGL